MWFLILYNEMCQPLEDLCNFVNEYFTNGQWVIVTKLDTSKRT